MQFVFKKKKNCPKKKKEKTATKKPCPLKLNNVLTNLQTIQKAEEHGDKTAEALILDHPGEAPVTSFTSSVTLEVI